MRKIISFLFVCGISWWLFKDIHFHAGRMYSKWAVYAHRLPLDDEIDREAAVILLKEMNAEWHKWHDSFYGPVWLIIGSACFLIFINGKQSR